MNTAAFVRHLFDEIHRTHPDKTVFEVVADVEQMVERLRAAAANAPEAAAPKVD